MTLKCILVPVFCFGVLRIEWNVISFYLNPLDSAVMVHFHSFRPRFCQTDTFFQQVTIFFNYSEALNLNMVLGPVRGAELYVLVKQSHLVNNENMPKRALLNYLLNENTTKSTVYYNFLSSTTVWMVHLENYVHM